MFFKKDDSIDRRAVDIACWITFSFWGVMLLINATLESFNKQAMSAWTILAVGLAIFFISEIIITKSRKSQATK